MPNTLTCALEPWQHQLLQWTTSEAFRLVCIHPIFCSVGTTAFVQGAERSEREADHSLHPVVRLQVNEAVHLYSFILVKVT
jgi:hypothetical protein